MEFIRQILVVLLVVAGTTTSPVMAVCWESDGSVNLEFGGPEGRCFDRETAGLSLLDASGCGDSLNACADTFMLKGRPNSVVQPGTVAGLFPVFSLFPEPVASVPVDFSSRDLRGHLPATVSHLSSVILRT